MTYENNVVVTLFLLVIVTFFHYVTMTLLYSMYLQFFDDVRTTSYFGSFKSRTVTTIQLFCILGRHFGITLFVVCLQDVWKCCSDITFLFVNVTFFITSQLLYLFVQQSFVFLMKLELRYVLVRLNYLRRLHYKTDIFSLNLCIC